MEWYTFKRAICYGDEFNVLGGGEPTLNPDFIPMVEWAVGYGANIWFVTNGSRVNKMKKIIELQEIYGEDKLGFEVSCDPFHDWKLQNPWLLAYAERKKIIRNTSDRGELMKAGRAKKLSQDYELQERCGCDDLNILPDGRVRLCGCLNAPIIGNINYSFDVPAEYYDKRCINYSD
jgi:MoaA/NifB/PqqE/SkfB family radical SAM enzyme